MELLLWIENSALGIYVREDPWGFAYALSAHAVGMGTVVGIVAIVTLRVMGMLTAVPILAYQGLFPIAWFGFIINLISGIMLYTSHATEYTFQWVFALKLGLIAIGGILMKFMMDAVRANDETKSRRLAALCLFSWIGAIVTGRLMAYF